MPRARNLQEYRTDECASVPDRADADLDLAVGDKAIERILHPRDRDRLRSGRALSRDENRLTFDREDPIGTPSDRLDLVTEKACQDRSGVDLLSAHVELRLCQLAARNRSYRASNSSVSGRAERRDGTSNADPWTP